MVTRPKAKTHLDPEDPRAWGTCDRCGTRYDLAALNYQKAWAGLQQIALKLRVCERCLDIPAPFTKTLIVGRDPIPLKVTRPDITVIDYRVTEARDQRTTEADDFRILDESGR